MKITVIGLLCLSLAGPLKAGSFGVKAGDPLSAYQFEPTGSRGKFTIQVPMPHSEFERYEVTATPETGICSVAGVGKTHNNDDFGTSIRKIYAELQSTLKKEFGTFSGADSLMPSGKWARPGQFATSLYTKQRLLASLWAREYGSINLTEQSSIALVVGAASPTQTWLQLKFEFENYDACKAILARRN